MNTMPTTSSSLQPSSSPMRKMDLILPAGVVALLAVLIIPLPTFVLDVLIALNLSCAILTLLVVLAAGDPMEFSTFPALLLFTTLLRLALNVASTRLILLNGDAGSVIQSFGGFVVGGDLVVGAVVFIILVVIQFVVITKGAGRISEVAARFTLDAMPGKQMSIDADLNAGLIDNDEARERREAISREAEFYGAMDGAQKFVRGDALAGLIITVVNLVGGITIGLTRGLGIQDALATYSILTVGDGLVSQIPALIIATAGGIIVTKSANDQRLGGEMTGQFASQPQVLALAATLILTMAIMPGLPAPPFIVLAMVILGLFVHSRRQRKLEEEPADGAITAEGGTAEGAQTPEEEARELAELLKVDRLSVEIGYRLIHLVDKEGGGLLDHISMVRRRFASELGLILPPVRVKDNIQLEPGGYRILANGQIIATGEVRPGCLLAMNPGTVQEEIAGVETVEPTFGLPARWIDEDKKAEAEMLGYTVVDSVAMIITHFTETVRENAHEVLSRDDVNTLIDQLKEASPALVDDLIPNVFTLGEVQRVMRGLLRERVPIRDLGTILETLAECAPSTKDYETLKEACRQRLSRSILEQFQDDSGTLHVITLDPTLEKAILEHASGKSQKSQPGFVRRVVRSIGQALRKGAEKGREPVILAKAEVRHYLGELIRNSFPRVGVLSYNEAAVASKVESLAIATMRNNAD